MTHRLLLCLLVTVAACKKAEDPCPSARQWALDNISPALGAVTTANDAVKMKLLGDWNAAIKDNKSIDLPATPPDGLGETYAKVVAYQKACHAK